MSLSSLSEFSPKTQDSLASHLSLESEQKAKHGKEDLVEKINTFFQKILPTIDSRAYERLIIESTENTKDGKNRFFLKTDVPHFELTIRILFLKTFADEEFSKEFNEKTMVKILSMPHGCLGALIHDIQLALESGAVERKARLGLIQTLKNEVSGVLKELATETPPDEIAKTEQFLYSLKEANIDRLHKFFEEATPQQIFLSISVGPIFENQYNFIYKIVCHLFTHDLEKLKAVMEYPCNFARILDALSYHIDLNPNKIAILDFIVEHLRKKGTLMSVLTTLSGECSNAIFEYLDVSTSEILETIRVSNGAHYHVRLVFSGLTGAIPCPVVRDGKEMKPLQTMLECLNAFPGMGLANDEIVKACLQGMLEPIKWNPIMVIGLSDDELPIFDDERRKAITDHWVSVLETIFDGLSAEMRPIMLRGLNELEPDKSSTFDAMSASFRSHVLEALRIQLSWKQASEYLLKDTDTLPASVVNGILSEYLLGPSPQTVFEHTKQAFADLRTEWPNTILDDTLKGYIS